MKKLLLLIFVLSLSPALCFSQPTIKSYKATYQVQTHGLVVGTITHELKFNPPHYQLTITSKSQIPLLALNGTETSSGLWESNYPIPLSYRYDYDYRDKTKFKIVHFDWQKKLATLTPGNMTIELEPQTQDKLSYQLALSYDLQKPNAQLRYRLIENTKTKSYQFKVIEHKTLHTALGKFDTILVERKGKTRTTQLWIAPSLHYVIVQAKHFNHDNLEASAEISQLEWLK